MAWADDLGRWIPGKALRRAGFHAERRDLSAGLEDVFDGMGEGLAEWIVTAPDGELMMPQLAYFDRSRDSVAMDVGPVLGIEDVAGGKVCALAGRVEPRDYADTAAMLGRFSPAQLIGFARRLDRETRALAAARFTTSRMTRFQTSTRAERTGGSADRSARCDG